MLQSKVFISLILLVSLLHTTSCKKEDPSPQDIVKSNLVGPIWKIKTVFVDGIDYTSSYTGMTIIFSESTYSTTKGGVVWPASGTWQFNSNNGSKIIRNDGVEITLSVTTIQLDMLLFWPTTTYSGGRSGSIKGNHVFTFTK